MDRWLSIDGELSGIGGEILGYNLFAYCFNDPVNMSDPTGNWPKWLTGALNVVSGAVQMAVGAALGATLGWTGIGAVAAGVLIVNGSGTVAQGVAQIVNDVANSNVVSEENAPRTIVKETGRAIGGETGAKIGAAVYDTTVTAANLYVGYRGLEQAGLAPIRVKINEVINNPADEFVTVGPKQGCISEYCRSIPQKGYGRIEVVGWSNGLYQLVDGHHRVAALRALGYKTIKVFLPKW